MAEANAGTHTTANGTTTAQATAYAGEDVPEAKAAPLLRDAERAVRDIAPPPSNPAPDAYKQDASDAELYMFAYYASGSEYISSVSLDGVSLSFRDMKDSNPVTERVERIMSRWIRGTPPGATVSPNRFSNVLERGDKW